MPARPVAAGDFGRSAGVKSGKYRALFGDRDWDDDFDDEEDDGEEEEEESSGDRPFDPDGFSRRQVNARLRQYAKGDRDWLFSD